jgi:phosphonate transport system substrate-binding protein
MSLNGKISIFIFSSLVALFAPDSEAQIQLRFGIYTSEKPTEMVKIFRPILNTIETDLKKRLGESVKIRIQVARNYAIGIEDLVQGKVDFARLGPASYVEAMQRNPKLKILAIESDNGNKIFNGVICVGKYSSIKGISELKGTSFAFGNERSTIGRYLSQQYLRNHGIHAFDLSHYEYLGRHDTVGTAVGAGKFKAGALKESTFNKLVKKGVPIRAIARFPNVTKPWIAREALPKKFADALSETLMHLKDPAALKRLKKEGFLPGDDEDFQIIREAMEQNELFFTPQNKQIISSNNS